MPRVLHVVASLDPKLGGVCQAVKTIISGLDNCGFENEVTSLDSPKADYLKIYPFKIHPLGPSKTLWNYSAKLMPWLVNNLSEFDYVVIHGLWLYHSYAVFKAINKVKEEFFKNGNATTVEHRRLPAVAVMPHGMLDPYFQLTKERRFKALRNTFFWKFIEHRVVNSAEGLFFTCEDERKLAHLPFQPYLPKKESIVSLGVEEPPLYSETMRSAFLEKCNVQNQPYLLFFGRINYKKGVDLVIEGYCEVFKRMAENSNSSCTSQGYLPKLVIAGPGMETAYGQKISSLVEKYSFLKESIFFTGMLSGNAKWGALYGCEAFILPSHQENFGIAVVEAMACSKAVLISNKVNIWREIEECGGAIVKNDDKKGVTEMIENWRRLSKEEKVDMGKHARSAFERHFSVKKATNYFIEALTTLKS